MTIFFLRLRRCKALHRLLLASAASCLLGYCASIEIPLGPEGRYGKVGAYYALPDEGNLGDGLAK